MRKILKYKSNILAYISSIVMIIGTILPIVVIANNDGSIISSTPFIIENGKLILGCAIIGVLLYLFKVGYFSFIPALGSLLILFIFYLGIKDSMIPQNGLISSYSYYGIGFYLMIIGSILLIISSILNFFDIKKYSIQAISPEFYEKPQLDTNTNETIKNNEIIKKTLSLSEEKLISKENSDFVYCINCGAIIKKGSKKCFFCDNEVNDNKM